MQKLRVTGSINRHPSSSRQRSARTNDNIDLVDEQALQKSGFTRNNICTLYLIIQPYSPQTLSKLVDECGRHSKPKQCRFWDTVYNMTDKTISVVNVSPSSAETLVRRNGIINHHSVDSLLSQQHHCKKLWKSVDMSWSYCVHHQCCFLKHSVYK